MKQTYPIYYPQFFTATILEWKHLLADDKHKDIIINSLKFLVTRTQSNGVANQKAVNLSHLKNLTANKFSIILPIC